MNEIQMRQIVELLKDISYNTRKPFSLSRRERTIFRNSPSTQRTCFKCDTSWYYKGTSPNPTCPSCGYKIGVKQEEKK